MNEGEIHVFSDTVVVADSFIKKLYASLESLAYAKAKQAVDSGKFQQVEIEKNLKARDEPIEEKTEVKEDKKRKQGARYNAGTGQGREVKTKSTKKKGHKGRHEDDDRDDNPKHR